MPGVIIIGDEILSGRRQDKHLTKAIELLQARGMALSWARYEGDDPARITRALKEALDSGEVVFSFGGIGATPDDHTRQCAAVAWGQPLALHPDAEPEILLRCREMAEQAGEPFDPHSADTQRRLQMGHFPIGSTIIPNPYNRIPGFSLGGRLHCVPGFPVMAWPMVAWVLDTLHADLHGQSRVVEKTVIVYETAESLLTPLMVAIERDFAPIKVFSLPSVDHPLHGRHIELGVKGGAAEVEAAFASMLAGVNQLGARTGPIEVRETVAPK